MGFNGAETNCGISHFRHPTDGQLRNVDIFFSNYNLQSVYFEFDTVQK